MQFVVVTGMSGSGISKAMDALEDLGFFCIENIPPKLISQTISICALASDEIQKYAILVDSKSYMIFGGLSKELDGLKALGYGFKLLFIDAEDSVLLKRYKETRRKHPLLGDRSMNEVIAAERETMKKVRQKSDYIIDTSFLSVSQLKQRIVDLFCEDKQQSIIINCMSFGFKYGLPSEADLVFDVRFLPNPFYIEELKEKTGLDNEIAEYVMSFQQSNELFEKLCGLLDYLIPFYRDIEGKSYLVIAIGCTGGKHRSVLFADRMCKYLKGKGGNIISYHRDINK